MKRKKLAGKLLSILLACALVFTSLETPVFAAEVTDISAEGSILSEDAQTEEGEIALAGETELSYAELTEADFTEESAEDTDIQKDMVTAEDTYEAAISEEGTNSSEEADAAEETDLVEDADAAGETDADADKDFTEETAETEDVIEDPEAADNVQSGWEEDTIAANEEDMSSATGTVSGDAAEEEPGEELPSNEMSAVSENSSISENTGVSENEATDTIYEEETMVYEDAATGIKAGSYIVYGGKKDVDFTYKMDEVTKVNTLKVITTTPLIIETKTGKASTPIVLGNAVSPCDIHVTIRKAAINVSDSQNVAAITIPDNYTKNVYLKFEDNVKLTSAANCAGIQKNITSDQFTKAGYLYIQGNTTVSISAGLGGAGIGSGIMEITDPKKSSPMSGKIVIEGNTITVAGSGGGAGIGGGKGSTAKAITITGGDVTATGKGGGAGIGGGAKNNGTGGDGTFISVKGGKVTAKGSDNAAGIGGGNTGEGSNITIYGGNITTEGGDLGAGIGGGSGKAGKDITIYGAAYLKAEGGSSGAGIGGGSKGAGNNITIHGGDEIIAEGGSNGAGIGGGNGKEGKSITINGGNVTATSFRGGAAIGGGNDGKGSEITITGGTVKAYANKERTSYSIGAGIGGGNGDAGENIVIKGGVVDARSDDGAGIGGGKAAQASNITIEEGNIYALGGNDAAGIGAGKGKNAGNIKITGGTIEAVTGSEAADHYSLGAGYGGNSSSIYISGGSVNASVNPACVVTKDETSNEALSCQVFINYTPGARISLTHITYADYYNAANLTADAVGKIYLWLPEGAEANPGEYANTYEVKFVTNCYTAEPAKYVSGGTKLQLPETKDYKVEQAVFDGWYTSPDFAESSEWTEDKTVSGDTVLYAKWKHFNYVYYYNTITGKYYATEKVYDGQKAQGIEDPVRTGFSFTGWYYLNSTTLFDFDTIITENVILSAGWDRNALAPIASVANGEEILEGAQIQLRSNTVGATIYYTTDGSKPTKESNVYLAPIVITSNMMLSDGTVMIRAFSVKEGLVDSGIIRYTYNFIPDSQNPGDVLKQDYPEGDITKIPQTGVWIAGLKDSYEYTGKAIKPEIRIYDGKKLLVEKKDYTITYKNNINAAGTKTPTMTITGKGNYKNKLEPVSFKINPANISEDGFEAADVTVAANGKVQKPSVVVTRNGKKLKNNKDYKVDYSKVGAAAGEYVITVTGIGNYCGSREVTLQVTEGIMMGKVSVSKIAAQEYTGQAIKPDVTVKYKGAVLANGKDYTLEYQDNVSAGTAKVIIKAVAGGRCTGTKTVTFKIKGVPMSKVKVGGIIPEVQYTGTNTQISGYQLYTTSGRELTLGKDYYVTYENNVNVGTAKIIFNGIGGYTGKLTAKFKIVPYNIAVNQYNSFEIKVADTTVYEKGGAVPEIRMLFKGKEMVEGKDYTLRLRNNNEVTTDKTKVLPTVSISGKGNFKGTLEDYTFTITQAPLSRVSFSVADVPFSETPGNHIVTPVLKDINGKTLTLGKDYDKLIQYTYYEEVKLVNGTVKTAGSLVGSTDVIPAGTEIMVRVAAKEGGNYSGAVTTKFRIMKKNIKGVSVTVKNQEYTGSEIMPGKTEIYSKTLTYNDYEIIDYSNNINKGTATITIRGIGNYGGTKKVKFKIGPKPLIWVQRKTTTAAE